MARVSISEGNGLYKLAIEIEKKLDVYETNSLLSQAIKEAAAKYAEQWISENLNEIYKQLDIKAITNLITLEVAKQVKDNILNKEK